jgi:hypothetical protein
MATNDFKALGINTGANVIDLTTYDASTILSVGFQSGICLSTYLNRGLRQGTVMANCIGQFMVNEGQNANDNGNISTLVTNYTAALNTLVSNNSTVPGAAAAAAAAQTTANTALSDATSALSSISTINGEITTINGEITTINSTLTTLAPINSPSFTGTPTAPTPTAGDNSTKLATTAFVTTAVSNASAFTGDTPASGVSSGSWLITTYGTVVGSRTVVGIGQGTCTNGQTVGIGGTTTYSPSQFIIAACVGTVDTSPVGTGSGWNGITTTCSVSGQTISVDAHETTNPSVHYSATAFWSGFFIQYNF